MNWLDALNREKKLSKTTKTATPTQPRGSKVTPGIVADSGSAPEPSASQGKAQRKFTGTPAATSRPSSAAGVQAKPESATIASSKRSSAPVLKTQPEQKSAPPERTSSAGKKRKSSAPSPPPAFGPEQESSAKKEGDPDQDAKGLYDILVQTRRCEELCSGLGLTMREIRKMKRKYDDNDMYHS
ncbi:unnamed protein product [Phytophthora fragariaefolia]|uniref:Unnamed protein product n=1 Tax=Phytophthora fragariaefolia TaxID=1490495 RepID=A0A9W6XFY9_9STRA|nr:unnamed protein product [Phytophthora fragariaefolia]